MTCRCAFSMSAPAAPSRSVWRRSCRERKWCATDVSLPALEIARHQCGSLQHRPADQFAGSDLFDSVGEGEFHLIVSNPPYVGRGELATLAPEVSQWEPRSALDGGLDGLDYYRTIISDFRHLLRGGALIMKSVLISDDRLRSC